MSECNCCACYGQIIVITAIDSNIIVCIDRQELININNDKITAEGFLGLNVYAGTGCFQNVNLVRLQNIFY